MNDRRWLRSVARGIVFLMQLGMSMLIPPVLCLLGAWYLQEKRGAGGWVWPLAIVLGLALGASSFMEFARLMQREADTAPATDWQSARPDRDTPQKPTPAGAAAERGPSPAAKPDAPRQAAPLPADEKTAPPGTDADPPAKKERQP